jgi:replication-associated recombination protein RarA
MTTRRNLSVELRPQRLSELVGQEGVVASLRRNFGAGSVPIGILLTGSFGQGKTTIARILGMAFNCTHQVQFGETCVDCLDNADMFNIFELNCADLTTIDQMKEFLPKLLPYPNFGKYRIIILDEAQQMSDKAQQILLTPLEELDSHNIFIFCTSNPAKINQAVKDRCKPFAIPDLKPAGVTALVNRTVELAVSRYGMPSIPMDPLIEMLHTAQVFSSRNVVMAVEMFLEGSTAAQAIVIKDAGEVDYFSLNAAVGQGKWEPARKILQMAKPADGAQVKMRLSAFFRYKLLETPAGSRADLLSLFIRELGDAAAVESGLELSLVVSAVYRICQTIENVKSKTSTNNPVLIKAA